MESLESPGSPLEKPLTGHRAGFYSIHRDLHSTKPGHSVGLSFLGPGGEQEA